MPGFPDPGSFRRHESGTWFLGLPLPATARIEYRLRVRRGSWLEEIDDPLNLPSTSNPFGSNCVITGPRYQAPWYAGGGHSGELSEVRVVSSALGGRRHHQVYLPSGQTAEQARALLLVHDGSDFLEHGGLGMALDLLCDKGVVPPLVAVLLDPWDRIPEYGGLQPPQHPRRPGSDPPSRPPPSAEAQSRANGGSRVIARRSGLAGGRLSLSRGRDQGGHVERVLRPSHRSHLAADSLCPRHRFP